MAGIRTRAMTEHRSAAAGRAAAVASLLQQECSLLLELYRKREDFHVDVSDGRLVSVPAPSSQLDTRDKLWSLHSALLQCRTFLERGIAKENEELGGGEKGKYEKQRETVKNRLSLLLINTGELLRAADGAAILTPNFDGSETESPSSLFELKLWIYRIYKEVEHWTKIAVTTLKELPSDTPKERRRITLSTRSKRR
ncbi:ciliary neurotrophic factor [Austrofundulus limnaeus]|uniref:Ciliary neurotrophic factor n=1 Tax=Austrofundulus limnaeus TaxID=52670 RepID=A0A2I4BLN6_AUSLI|nr:PREDICTED: ciliary neurotrophic factor-like [Austrofundulus limnaeus]